MSLDPTADLFKAVRAALVADGTLATEVGGRVFSDWAAVADFPMIRLSIPTSQDDEDDCGPGARSRVQVHIYTKTGVVNRSLIAGRVRAVLDDADLTLDNSVLASIEYQDTINRADNADPKVLSAVLRFEATTTVPNS